MDRESNRLLEKLPFTLANMNFDELSKYASISSAVGFNTKSTGAQGILKPKSVIPREEGGLGFLIITRAQPEG